MGLGGPVTDWIATILRYVDHIDEGEGLLSDAQIDAFASARPPWTLTDAGTSHGDLPAAGDDATFVPPGGPVGDYLRRVGWITPADEGTHVTELGWAMVRGALAEDDGLVGDALTPPVAQWPSRNTEPELGRRFQA